MARHAASLEERADPAAASEAGILFAMVGELERAERLARAALDRQSDARARAVTEIRLAQILQLRGRLPDAQRLLRAVAERCRTFALPLLHVALQHLGKVHFEAGEMPQALACLEEALALRAKAGDPELVACTRQAIAAVGRRMR
jgi:tetratricopeptide (TPR) repeat protein